MIVQRMAFSKHILSYLKSRKKQEGELRIMSTDFCNVREKGDELAGSTAF